jgi:hypothetical protein
MPLKDAIERLSNIAAMPQPGLAKNLRCVELADLNDILAELTMLSGSCAPDFASVLTRQARFSLKTFGPGRRTGGILAHIRKEIAEVEKNPTDLTEWADVAILAMDGAWRHCAYADQNAAAPSANMLADIGVLLCNVYVGKLRKNEARTWPDWRTASPDQAIEHDRSAE